MTRTGRTGKGNEAIAHGGLAAQRAWLGRLKARVEDSKQRIGGLRHFHLRGRAYAGVAAVIGALSAMALVVAPTASSASGPSVPLGTDSTFAVLASSTVTNTGSSVISGNLGVYAGTSVTGFPPGVVSNGSIHIADGVARQAQSDLTTAYNAAADASSTETITGDLAGRTLTPGVYTSASSLGLSGALTLNAAGNPSAVFIFQAGSMLTVNTGSSVVLTGGAQACNVFWQVGSSATVNTDVPFVGHILAADSITMDTGATLIGSALASTAAVTLDDNTITEPTCSKAGTTGNLGSGNKTGTGGKSGGGSGSRKGKPKSAKSPFGFTG
jgi:hypothetical protein